MTFFNKPPPAYLTNFISIDFIANHFFEQDSMSQLVILFLSIIK